MENVKNEELKRLSFVNSELNSDYDYTRCGVSAENILNNIYFESEDEKGMKVEIYGFDLDGLQRKMKNKDLICKVIWSVWNLKQFEEGRRSGDFVMPEVEHTLLIDIPLRSDHPWMIQSLVGSSFAFKTKMSIEGLWNYFKFLECFDRETKIQGKDVIDWINEYLNIKLDPSMESTPYIGHLVSFNCYSYNKDETAKRIQNNLK